MSTPQCPPVAAAATPVATANGTDRRQFLARGAGMAAVLGLPGLGACGGGGGEDAAAAPAPAPGPTAPAPPVNGPAWWGFGRDAQHAAISAVATQNLSRIAWRTPVDLAPQYRASGALLIHYGSPVITSRNTALVPVKTGASGGFRIEARSGGNGFLLWQLDTDYRLPAANWLPSYNLTLTPSGRLLAPAAGGRLLARDEPDSANGATQWLVFYGAAAYAAASAVFDSTVLINTPVTVDAAGNAYFGFVVVGSNPAGLVSGLARMASDGSGRWVSATVAAGDAAITKLATNCAPALSPDGRTLYIGVNTPGGTGTVQRGWLLALDSSTLATTGRVELFDPGTGTRARVSDDGTASPTVGPDGEVYFGVLESSYGSHNGRGWLLHFNATLTATRVPGGFGWDNTASIVPATMLPAYSGPSSYLLMIKYNNYAGAGSGDGANRLAIVDPGQSQIDPISGLPIMRELLTILGPTPEGGGAPGVKEWCINTASVDPATRSVLANSEDGWLYRWDLAGNRFSQRLQLTSGIAEAYTPVAVGADGAVYAINNAVLFCVGA